MKSLFVFLMIFEILSFSLSIVKEVDTFSHSYPLHTAISKGDVKKVKYLIEAGEDVNMRNNKGNTPLHVSINSITYKHQTKGLLHLVPPGTTDILKPLVFNKTKYLNYLEITKLLIRQKANVNIKNKNGKTALHSLVESGDSTIILELAPLLIKAGGDINNKNVQGNTLLHLANTIKIVKFLIQKGADINAKNNKGNAPLHRVHKLGLETIKFLLKQGAEVNIKNNEGSTPLHLAVSEENIKITKLLIDKGVDVNSKDNKGLTPLHLAVSKGNIEIIKFIMNKKADVNIKDNEGSTPFHKMLYVYGREKNKKIRASDKKRHWETIKMFIKHGADIKIKDNKGQTPLDYADFLMRWKIRFYIWTN